MKVKSYRVRLKDELTYSPGDVIEYVSRTKNGTVRGAVRACVMKSNGYEYATLTQQDTGKVVTICLNKKPHKLITKAGDRGRYVAS